MMKFQALGYTTSLGRFKSTCASSWPRSLIECAIQSFLNEPCPQSGNSGSVDGQGFSNFTGLLSIVSFQESKRSFHHADGRLASPGHFIQIGAFGLG